MSPELVAIIGVGVAVIGIVVTATLAIVGLLVTVDHLVLRLDP